MIDSCINIFVWTVFLALDFNTVDFIVEICILLLVNTKKIQANKILFQKIKAGNFRTAIQKRQICYEIRI